ncbi:MAG: serine/threonine-protein kinase, partial [Bacteroidia bacterium]
VLREVRAFLRLRHGPNLARVDELLEENDTFYMVFDYIEGSTLSDMIQNAGKIDPWECLGYMEDIAKALDFIHSQRLLHRDVTPNNIIIRPSGQAVLIDFGAARLYENNKTQSMTSMLNSDYAPPEQFAGEGHYSPALDIYSFGASFYHALTGEKPPNAVGRYMAIDKGKTDTLASLLQLRFDLHPCLGEIIHKCMKVKAEERYPNMSEVLVKITECKQKLAQEGPSSVLGSETSGSPKGEEIRSLLILLALILFGVGLGIALAIWL